MCVKNKEIKPQPTCLEVKERWYKKGFFDVLDEVVISVVVVLVIVVVEIAESTSESESD